VGHAVGEAVKLRVRGLKLGSRPLALVLQTRVLERDGGLGGERGGDGNIFRGESLGAPGPDTEHPYEPDAGLDRYAEEGPVAGIAQRRPMRGNHPGIVGRVSNEERLTRRRHDAA
jgi:hypothetical protein